MGTGQTALPDFRKAARVESFFWRWRWRDWGNVFAGAGDLASAVADFPTGAFVLPAGAGDLDTGASPWLASPNTFFIFSISSRSIWQMAFWP